MLINTYGEGRYPSLVDACAGFGFDAWPPVPLVKLKGPPVGGDKCVLDAVATAVLLFHELSFRPLTVFDDDDATSDGTCIRDYVHVSDLADAHILALEQVLARRVGLVLNLGLGHGFSVREVIGAIKRVTGLSVPCVGGPRRDGDPPILVARVDKAVQMLKWKPRYVNLEFIVQTAWTWRQRSR